MNLNMANPQQPSGLSSAFDDMLAKSKERFDDLYIRQQPVAASFTVAQALPGSDWPTILAGTAAPAQLDPDSPVVRQLNDRFGDNWRFEIAEQQRDGDEAIVLGRLILGKDGAVRTQFGRAAIGAKPVAGASGGVMFQLGAGGDTDERDAFRRATEAALINCAELG
ncbi:MAG: hypothetical protein WBD95_04050 [Xanthobacteraceae bacterium]